MPIRKPRPLAQPGFPVEKGPEARVFDDIFLILKFVIGCQEKSVKKVTGDHRLP